MVGLSVPVSVGQCRGAGGFGCPQAIAETSCGSWLRRTVFGGLGAHTPQKEAQTPQMGQDPAVRPQLVPQPQPPLRLLPNTGGHTCPCRWSAPPSPLKSPTPRPPPDCPEGSWLPAACCPNWHAVGTICPPPFCPKATGWGREGAEQEGGGALVGRGQKRRRPSRSGPRPSPHLAPSPLAQGSLGISG